MSFVNVSKDYLRKYIEEVLVKAGLSGDSSKIIANTLVEANLRGVDTHGVIRLPMYYLRRIKAGLISKNPHYRVEKHSSSTAILDADNGPGQVATLKAMKLAIEIARADGVGLVGIKNSSHFGMAAYFAMEALKEDMIGIALTQADARVAPFGAKNAYLGTNPVAFAVPAGKCYPIVLDMATSSSSMGKIILAVKEREPIPPGLAIDENGEVTTDPTKVAALLPSGGAKGSGLAIMVDILSGVLMGASFGIHINKGDDFTKPEKLAHLVGAINISSFSNVEQFKQRIDQMVMEIKNLPRASGFQEILLPGEKEFKTREKRLKEGIPIPKEVFNELQGLEGCYISHYTQIEG